MRITPEGLITVLIVLALAMFASKAWSYNGMSSIVDNGNGDYTIVDGSNSPYESCLGSTCVS